MSFNLREGIKQALLANAAIAALVGARVWDGYAPSNVTAAGPWIVYRKIYGGEEGAMDGDQALTHPTYQFTIGGTNKVNVNAVQQLLVKFNCTNYAHEDKVLTFYYKDDQDAWSDGARVQEPSVDLEIWVEE